jgi:hypothetical protein
VLFLLSREGDAISGDATPNVGTGPISRKCRILAKLHFYIYTIIQMGNHPFAAPEYLARRTAKCKNRAKDSSIII